MRRFLLLPILIALPLTAQTRGVSNPPVDLSKPPASSDPKPYRPPPVSEIKLSNGLTVIMAEDSRFPLVTERLVFLAGDKRDPKEIPGLATTVAAMLTRLTPTRTYRWIAEEVDSLGGTLKASAGADALTIDASVLAENAVGMLTLISDISRNTLFPTDDLAIHGEIREALLAQRSQPDYLAKEEYRKLVFGDSPYAHLGPTAAAIDKTDSKALRDFRDNLLVPNNAYLVLVGKLPARADLLREIAKEFGSWQQKTVPAYAAPKPPEPKRQVVLIDRPGSDQAELRLGRLGATYRDNTFVPETVASIIEGGWQGSRLFQDIVKQRGLAYDVRTEVNALADAGTFSTVAEVRNEVVADALEEVLRHLDKMAKEPVEKQELNDARNYAIGVFLLGLESQGGVADQLAQIRVMNLPKNYLESYTNRINSVGSDQIESAAKMFMAPDNDSIVVVGDALELRKLLEKIGTFQVLEPTTEEPKE